MMPDHNQQRYVPYYQHEQRRRADQFRLALVAGQGRSRIRFYYPLMQRIGAWLIASGTRLQARYGQLKQAANASMEMEAGRQAAPIHPR